MPFISIKVLEMFNFYWPSLGDFAKKLNAHVGRVNWPQVLWTFFMLYLSDIFEQFFSLFFCRFERRNLKFKSKHDSITILCSTVIISLHERRLKFQFATRGYKRKISLKIKMLYYCLAFGKWFGRVFLRDNLDNLSAFSSHLRSTNSKSLDAMRRSWKFDFEMIRNLRCIQNCFEPASVEGAEVRQVRLLRDSALFRAPECFRNQISSLTSLRCSGKFLSGRWGTRPPSDIWQIACSLSSRLPEYPVLIPPVRFRDWRETKPALRWPSCSCSSWREG